MTKYIDQIEDFCVSITPVGSRETCNPAPMDTDMDLLCMVDGDDYEIFLQWLERHGWEWESEYGRMHGDFDSYRKDIYNLIITTDEDFHTKFLEATAICKEKNLLEKSERVAVFDEVFGRKKVQYVTYGSGGGGAGTVAGKWTQQILTAFPAGLTPTQAWVSINGQEPEF